MAFMVQFPAPTVDLAQPITPIPKSSLDLDGFIIAGGIHRHRFVSQQSVNRLPPASGMERIHPSAAASWRRYYLDALVTAAAGLPSAAPTAERSFMAVGSNILSGSHAIRHACRNPELRGIAHSRPYTGFTGHGLGIIKYR